jgi:(p)ppGpp synthase/HD superfamily hydrolase
MRLPTKAARFAEVAHAGQVRKFSGVPYVTHVRRVAAAAHQFGLGEAAVEAALLHDVVEDTDHTISDILNEFGVEVAGYVWGLTNAQGRGVATPGIDNRAKRKGLDRGWYGTRDAIVRSIKLLDVIDNLGDWPRSDSFFPKFVGEIEQLGKVLVPGLAPGLVAAFNAAMRLAKETA